MAALLGLHRVQCSRHNLAALSVLEKQKKEIVVLKEDVDALVVLKSELRDENNDLMVENNDLKNAIRDRDERIRNMDMTVPLPAGYIKICDKHFGAPHGAQDRLHRPQAQAFGKGDRRRDDRCV